MVFLLLFCVVFLVGACFSRAAGKEGFWKRDSSKVFSASALILYNEYKNVNRMCINSDFIHLKNLYHYSFIMSLETMDM